MSQGTAVGVRVRRKIVGYVSRYTEPGARLWRAVPNNPDFPITYHRTRREAKTAVRTSANAPTDRSTE